MKIDKRNTTGFTLVELLVVIAVLALLAGLALPALLQSSEASNQTKCLSNMRQISSLYLTMVVDQDGVLVAATGSSSTWYEALESYGYINKTGDVQKDMENYKKLSCPKALAVLGNKYNVTRATYGLNTFIGNSNGPTRMVQLSKPSATLLIGDGDKMGSGNGMTMNLNVDGKKITPYHNKKCAITYFDGHSAIVDQAVIATNASDIFWKGL